MKYFVIILFAVCVKFSFAQQVNIKDLRGKVVELTESSRDTLNFNATWKQANSFISDDLEQSKEAFKLSANICRAYINKGLLQEGYDRILESQKIFKSHHNDTLFSHYGESEVIAALAFERRDLAKTLHHLTAAEKIFRAIDEPYNMNMKELYHKLIFNSMFTQNYEAGIKYYNFAKTGALKNDDIDYLIRETSMFGGFLFTIDARFSKEYLEYASTLIARKYPNGNDPFYQHLFRLGNTYGVMGDLDASVKYFEQCLQRIDAASQRDFELNRLGLLKKSVFTSLGYCYYLKNDREKEKKNKTQALELATKNKDRDPSGYITALNQMVDYYIDIKEYKLALKYLDIVGNAVQQYGVVTEKYLRNRALVFNNLNVADSAYYNIQQAICSKTRVPFNGSIDYYPEINDMKLEDFTTLLDLILIKADIIAKNVEGETKRKRLEKCYSYLIDRAIYFSKLSISEFQLQQLSRYIDQNLVPRVINFAKENKESTELIDQLYKVLIDSKNYALQYTLNSNAESSSKEEKVVTQLSNELRAIDEQLKDIDKKEDIAAYDSIFSAKLTLNNKLFLAKQKVFRATKPASIKKAEHVGSVEKVQQQLKQSDLVIDYYVVDSTLCRFAITNNSFSYSFKPYNAKEKSLIVGKMRSIKRGEQSSLTKGVYDLLLGDLDVNLKEKKQLLIFPDDMLYRFPFETIIDNGNEMLINSHVVKYIYTLDLKSKQVAVNNYDMLALAPGFEDGVMLTDSDVYRDYEESKLDSLGVMRTSNGYMLKPLPNSLKEIDEIGALFKTQNKHCVIMKGYEATREKLIRESSNASILHVATHATYSKRSFMMSGLYLWDTDKKISLLKQEDIYKLSVPCNLVVLSACQTALGVIKDGDGALGLPRGFFVAGAKNVLSTLWKVHDEKTKTLMVAFYRHLLNDQISYAQALRLAKLECIKKGYLPLDWAGFVLVGNE
ncbi:CHAT domain-containing protein [Puteibacter caeruleilacunae]|nr:CHAT domain-containing protein [Puteibacter caeruleilacunae]